MVELCQ